MKTDETPSHLTPAETVELAELEAHFRLTGGRGVDIAERIDQLRNKRAGSPMVLCVRHPDYANEFTVYGDVRVIDIDLGGGFDITHGVERDVAAEYIWSYRNQVRDLPRNHPIRRAVYEIIDQVIEAAEEK